MQGYVEVYLPCETAGNDLVRECECRRISTPNIPIFETISQVAELPN